MRSGPSHPTSRPGSGLVICCDGTAVTAGHFLKDPHERREAARYENPVASREHILTTLGVLDGTATLRQLANSLGQSRDQDEGLAARLGAMVRAGQLRQDGARYLLPDQASLVTGKVLAHADGYGFVSVADGDDIYLSRSQIRGVLNGDEVQVRVSGVDRRGRLGGHIVEVLQRNTASLVGVLVHDRSGYWVDPVNRRQPQRVGVNEKVLGGALPGQIVVVVITRQPDRNNGPEGRIDAVLGDYLTPGIEVEMAIRANDLPTDFPAEALAQADDLPVRVPTSAKQGRADLRNLPFVTIDGEDARDFDDAVYCEPVEEGFRLLVAIADVAHYVRPGTPIDEEAQNRGTSVYFPQYVIPMLPESLSNGLCSLKEGVDRLAIVCEMTIGRRGAVRSYCFHDAVIRSHRRFTYTRVQEILDGGSDALAPSVRSLHDLYKVLLAARGRRGAVDFDGQEVRFVLDEAGAITDIVPVYRNDAHRLIEECMLCANVCAAQLVAGEGPAALYRVHDTPDAERVESLRVFLAGFGITLGGDALPRPGDYAAAALALRGRKNGRVLQLALLRSMQQAVYQPENRGHFGLNYPAYTHFTSPIRRYPDLMTHRYIKAAIYGSAPNPHVSRHEVEGSQIKNVAPLDLRHYPYADEEVDALGKRSSMTERRADAASWEVQEYMKCKYLVDHVGEIEEGVITSATGFGLFVELSRLFCEGLVHVSTLGGEFFRFDQGSQSLVGDRSGRHFSVGDPVQVQIVRVDLEARKVDLQLVEHQTSRRKVRGGGRGRSGQERSGQERSGQERSGQARPGASGSPRRRPASRSARSVGGVPAQNSDGAAAARETERDKPPPRKRGAARNNPNKSANADGSTVAGSGKVGPARKKKPKRKGKPRR